MRVKEPIDRLELWKNYSEAKAVAMGATWRTEALTVEVGRRMVSALSALVPAVPEAHVIDIGCGTGEVTLMVANAGYRATGLDVSKSLAAEFRKRTSDRDIDLIIGDVMTIPAQKTFDAAISRYVFTHYSDFRRLLGAIARFVKPGGIIVFDSFSDEAVEFAATINGKNADDIASKCYGPLPSFSSRELSDFCDENGLSLVRRAPLDFLHRNPLLAMTYDSQADTDAFLKGQYENETVRSFLNWLNLNVAAGLDSRFAGMTLNIVRVN